MPTSLLLALPLELRTQIWNYVLTGPYGRIELIKAHSQPSSSIARYRIYPPTTDDGRLILLSLLRTNSQIYTETKPLLWALNTLYLSSLLSPAHDGLIPPLLPSLTYSLRSIALPIDLTFHKTLSGHLLFVHNLRTLVTWIRHGTLSSITLLASAVSGTLLTMRNFEKIVKRRRHFVHSITYREYLIALNLGTDPKSPLSEVKRRFVVETGPTMIGDSSFRPKPLVGNPMPLLHEIARAWGGRLEVNGLVAFEDGRVVEDVFLVQEEEKGEAEGGEGKGKRFVFRDDVELWLASQIMAEEDENKEAIYVPGYRAGWERSERRAFCARNEKRMRELMAVHGIRRILEEEEEEEEEEGMGGDED